MRLKALSLALALATVAGARALTAQDTPPATPTPVPETPAAESETKDKPAFRPIESNMIINLPSSSVPSEGTMTFFVTHRFQTGLEDSDISNFFSLDDGADVGLGLGYVAFKKFEVSFYRSSFNSLATYEFAGKYQALQAGPVDLTLRLGNDLRTQRDILSQNSLFAQAIVALQLGPYVRLTAVPTYVRKTSGQPSYNITGTPEGSLLSIVSQPEIRNVFNVPVGASIALTHSITIHGEVVPSYDRTIRIRQEIPSCTPAPCPTLTQNSSPGIGWRVSVEKALLRHRFAFTAGNLQETTVDQYTVSNFGYLGGTAKTIRIGFNLMRQWKVK